jgi:hypothetical protein
MNKDAILKAIEKYSQSESTLGKFAKIIGTDSGGQTISILMVFGKADVPTAEEAYALYLLDDANTDHGLYYAASKTGHVVVKPAIVVGDDKSVGREASWEDVKYVQSCLASEGLHIPLDTTGNSEVRMEDIVHSFAVGDATNMTIIAEIETTFVIMNWVTSA